jgi:hypothetical protein
MRWATLLIVEILIIGLISPGSAAEEGGEDEIGSHDAGPN